MLLTHLTTQRNTNCNILYQYHIPDSIITLIQINNGNYTCRHVGTIILKKEIDMFI